ncbi:GDSL-type esterase/lipase family protein [Mucilaginibacter sp. CSA2-8R]|uniref:GDSL-type esterase/lipase family protein n=1 Tax=Mucilaginibacter sp. CSA2-8R TaxID=3141542 RepID=UPI00315D04EC
MHWYEDEVKALEKKIRELPYQPETLFYGSSSIRLWSSLNDDFMAYKPINLGFGGSTLAACVWFFDRLMVQLNPKRLVVYAGDNDLSDGRNPEEVFIFFEQLVVKAQQRFGNLPCYYISIKPSPSRWHLADQFRYANNLIESEIIKQDNNWRFINIFEAMLDADHNPKKEYYGADFLHMNPKGYELWTQLITQQLSR